MRRAFVLLLLGALFVPASAGELRLEQAHDIAILLTDQQSGDALGIEGTPGLSTPKMDALAREGVRFTRAFCATPQCSPSRAALLTGRYPHWTGVIGNVAEARGETTGAGMSLPLPQAVPTLGTVFSAAGYRTAYFGKWHLGGKPSQHGFEVDRSSNGNDGMAAEVSAFLKEKEQGQHRPLVMVVSWINPHHIYGANQVQDITPEELAKVRAPESLSDDLSTKPAPQRQYLTADQGKPYVGYDAEGWRRYRAYYYRLLKNVDAEIGTVVRALRARNPKTLIVFSSDHGDLQGAHGLPYKGPAMYDELVRIPLIFSEPGQIKPGVCSELVGNMDLLPTLCDLAGVKPPEGTDGKSMRPLLETGKAEGWLDALVGEYYGKQNWRVPIRMLRTKTWKYVRYQRYGEELYDLESDPHEIRNLASTPAQVGKKAELSGRLDRWIAENKDPFPMLKPTNRRGVEE